MVGPNEASPRAKSLKAVIRATGIVVAWATGLVLLSIFWIGWMLGDGDDLVRSVLSVPLSNRQLEPIIPFTSLVIWLPGVIAAQRIHRSVAVTLGIAGVGLLLTVFATSRCCPCVDSGTSDCGDRDTTRLLADHLETIRRLTGKPEELAAPS